MSQYLFDKNILHRIDKSVYNFNSEGILFPEVGPNLILRPLSADDFDKGFLQVLQQLTDVGDISQETFLNRFRSMSECKNNYYITVVEDTSKNMIVASASLVIEQKFIHSCGVRGRIEDVVVSKEYRRKDLGKILVSTLSALAEILNCYKLTLECKDQLLPFYESFGFKKEPNNSNYLQKRFHKS